MVNARRNVKKGRVTEICSPQSVLVNGIPCHLKDLCPHHGSISSEDNGNYMSSESDSGTLLLFRVESDDSPAEPEEIELEYDDAENEREVMDRHHPNL